MIGKKRIRHFFTLAFNKYAASEEVPMFLLTFHHHCRIDACRLQGMSNQGGKGNRRYSFLIMVAGLTCIIRQILKAVTRKMSRAMPKKMPMAQSQR